MEEGIERMQELEDAEEHRKILSSEHGMAVALRKLQQLCLLAQNLHKREEHFGSLGEVEGRRWSVYKIYCLHV